MNRVNGRSRRLCHCNQNIEDAPIIFSSFKNEQQDLLSYWFLWDEELPPEPVQLVREKFNFHHGLTYVKRTKDYYDMIAVALPEYCPSAGTFYLNKQKTIERFINQFEKKHQQLLQQMDKNPIKLPPAYRDLNYKELCLTRGRINIPGKTGMTYITVQEANCLRLLLQGNSYKEIACRLGLSPRTIETYIIRIKQRTGLKTRLELENLIMLCP